MTLTKGAPLTCYRCLGCPEPCRLNQSRRVAFSRGLDTNCIMSHRPSDTVSGRLKISLVHGPPLPPWPGPCTDDQLRTSRRSGKPDSQPGNSTALACLSGPSFSLRCIMPYGPQLVSHCTSHSQTRASDRNHPIPHSPRANFPAPHVSVIAVPTAAVDPSGRNQDTRPNLR